MKPAENYILNQPEPYCSMLMHLQSVIELTISDLVLKYKYKVPFYYCFDKPFCYLNQSKNYIDVGFWSASLFTIHQEYMTVAGRKTIRSLRYTTLEEIDNTILIEVLEEAYRIQFEKVKKR